jgi:hypothetical protein
MLLLFSFFLLFFPAFETRTTQVAELLTASALQKAIDRAVDLSQSPNSDSNRTSFFAI